MNHTLHHYRKILFLGSLAAACLSFGAASAMAQTGQPAGSGLSSAATDSVVVGDAGRLIALDSETLDGDLTVLGDNIDVVVSGGTHTINGNVQINGSGDRIIVDFDEEVGHGHMKVNGTLMLGPDSAPTLELDLSKVNLGSGAGFSIVDATEIVGEFDGLPNGSTLRSGGYVLRIVYSPTSISLIVVSAPSDRIPFVTPVIEVNPDLIDPTSTGPTSW